MSPEFVRKLLALSSLKGVGSVAIKKITKLPSWESLGPSEIGLYVKAVAGALSESSDAWDVAQSYADNQINALERSSVKLLLYGQADYPAILRDNPDAPYFLFVRGNLRSDIKSVGVIGTREPTPHGKIIAQRITEFLCEKRIGIVSGLALGCDTVAHETSLARAGYTIAVMAHGLQIVTPNQNSRLADKILESGGALVSSYPLGNAPTKYQYAERDKLQAGLSDGVVMIQSDLTGGSIHASKAILKYGRWLAYPHPTPLDIEKKEKKVELNIFLSEASVLDRLNFFKMPEEILRRVIRLNTRADYKNLPI